jgi:hypothetical protein
MPKGKLPKKPMPGDFETQKAGTPW